MRQDLLTEGYQIFPVYGRYGYDLCIEKGDLKICFSRDGDVVRYSRTLGDSTMERIIASDGGRVIINPVEPLNLPDEVTRFLEIRFESIIIEPEATRRIYLTFPIEIGVFISKKAAFRCIDIFSRAQPKYSLYGPTDTGVITRYHWSPLSLALPAPDPCCEGVVELDIVNTTKGWVEVSRVVLENYGMKIYYDGNLVSIKA
ncbi:MAG TPA: DUF432 domain-containing protein, partial [Methanofollis liminatans]|nr:DUF432 domain-containing protein [Methanofollis liminatans]